MQIGPINEYTGEMASSLVEAGHGDIEVAEHAIHMNWPPCLAVMSAACMGRHFELLKLFRKAWAGCPGSAIGFQCTDSVLQSFSDSMWDRGPNMKHQIIL